MSINAIEVQGMKFQVGSGASPHTFADIPEVKTFSGPGGSASVTDVTDIASTGKEKRMGLRDEGQLQLTINYLPDNTQHMALRTARANRTLTPFKIIFTDAAPATTWTFYGYVTGFSVSGGVDNVVEGQVTIEISGSIVEA